MKNASVLVLCPILVLLGSFFNYLSYQQYGLLEPEVLVSLFTMIVIGGALGLGLLAANLPIRFAGFILLTLFFLDQHGIVEIVYSLTGGLRGALTMVMAGVAIWAVLMAMYLVREHLPTIFATVFATVMVSGLALPSGSVEFGPRRIEVTAPLRADLDPIIHLVLDGHAAVEGIPRDIDGGPELQEDLRRFYEAWGFRLYGRAYSPYFQTNASLGSLMNGDASPATYRYVKHVGGYTNIITANGYFEKFAKAGYRIRVYQSDYFDVCQGPGEFVEFCYTYPFSRLYVIQDLDLSVLEKAKWILGRYVMLSSVYKLTRFMNPDWGWKNYNDLFTLTAMDVIERSWNDVLEAPRGRLFFIHLPLPHGPYVWDAACRLRPDTDAWGSRKVNHEFALYRGTPEYRVAMYKQYFAQVRCIMSRMDALFRAMRERGILEDATIVVHGDHGSRITLLDPYQENKRSLSPEDYVDSFSTLYAIRAPGVTPGYDDRPATLHNLFSTQVLGAPPPAEDGMVFLIEKSSNPMLPSPMPAFGTP